MKKLALIDFRQVPGPGAELMIELKVDKIISGDFGPKAKELLEEVNIQMVIIQDSTNIKEIVDRIVV